MSFNRTCTIEIKTQSGTKIISGLNVRFRVSLVGESTNATAEIGICNLKRTDLEYLTTYTTWIEAVKERKRIRLFVGYEDTQTALIFDGDIYSAIPTEPPDVWLNIMATSVNYEATQVFTRQVLVPSSSQSIAEMCASTLGLSLDWKATTKKTIAQFSFSGNSTKLLDRLNSIGDIIAFTENDTLVVVDRDSPDRGDKIIEISENTGMVGIPKVTFIGIEAKMFLNTNIRRMDTVHLTSNRIPAANGNYKVFSITHEGELRGQPWYTTVDARRSDVYE